MFWMLVLGALLVCAVSGNDMRFEYQISEGKARFVEEIETNLKRNTVKIYTPAHNNVLESYKMQDFKKGQQITCLPAIRQCRLRNLQKQSSPDAGQITEAFVHSWNKGDNIISSNNSKVITELYYIDDEKVVDTALIGADLRRFYESFGYPMYSEMKIPNDAKLLNITHSRESRTKRAFNSLQSDCNGQPAKRVYGVDSGRSCNYLKICKEVGRINGQDVFTDCGNVHITSPLAYVCVCCPWVQVIHTSGSDCKCTKMDGSEHSTTTTTTTNTTATNTDVAAILTGAVDSIQNWMDRLWSFGKK